MAFTHKAGVGEVDGDGLAGVEHADLDDLVAEGNEPALTSQAMSSGWRGL